MVGRQISVFITSEGCVFESRVGRFLFPLFCISPRGLSVCPRSFCRPVKHASRTLSQRYLPNIFVFQSENTCPLNNSKSTQILFYQYPASQASMAAMQNLEFNNRFSTSECEIDTHQWFVRLCSSFANAYNPEPKQTSHRKENKPHAARRCNKTKFKSRSQPSLIVLPAENI